MINIYITQCSLENHGIFNNFITFWICLIVCVYIMVQTRNHTDISLEDTVVHKPRKLGTKSVRIGDRYNYLNKAHTQGFLPRGFAEQVKFTISLANACQDIMNFAG